MIDKKKFKISAFIERMSLNKNRGDQNSKFPFSGSLTTNSSRSSIPSVKKAPQFSASLKISLEKLQLFKAQLTLHSIKIYEQIR